MDGWVSDTLTRDLGRALTLTEWAGRWVGGLYDFFLKSTELSPSIYPPTSLHSGVSHGRGGVHHRDQGPPSSLPGPRQPQQVKPTHPPTHLPKALDSPTYPPTSLASSPFKHTHSTTHPPHQCLHCLNRPKVLPNGGGFKRPFPRRSGWFPEGCPPI